MPFKNPRCRKCHTKMKHDRWLEYAMTGSYGAELWYRIVKCPKCGNEQRDRKARWGHKK